jgi:hypothetical protein
MVRPERELLSGTIEVDETYIGGEENAGKQGRGTNNKTLVAVTVEMRDGKHLVWIRLSIIPFAGGFWLSEFVKSNVKEGSTVVTDWWKGHSFLEKSGYPHVVHKKKDAEGEGESPPHVHLVISLLKRWLLGTHQGAVSEKHMQAYLDEFVFRLNKRRSAKRGLLFYRLLECAM